MRISRSTLIVLAGSLACVLPLVGIALAIRATKPQGIFLREARMQNQVTQWPEDEWVPTAHAEKDRQIEEGEQADRWERERAFNKMFQPLRK